MFGSTKTKRDALTCFIILFKNKFDGCATYTGAHNTICITGVIMSERGDLAPSVRCGRGRSAGAHVTSSASDSVDNDLNLADGWYERDNPDQGT